MIIAKEVILTSSLAWPDVRKAVNASARKLFLIYGPRTQRLLRKQGNF
jgi:hypothetical protein